MRTGNQYLQETKGVQASYQRDTSEPDRHQVLRCDMWPCCAVPRCALSVLVAGEGQQLLLTKGAPEFALSRCALTNSGPPPTPVAVETSGRASVKSTPLNGVMKHDETQQQLQHNKQPTLLPPLASSCTSCKVV